MSFRVRLTLLTALAVAVAIVGTSFVVYYTDRSEQMHQVDGDLTATERVPPLNAMLAYRGGRFSVVGPRNAVHISGSGAGFLLGPSGAKAFRKTVVLPHSSVAVQITASGRKNAFVGPIHAKQIFTTTSLKGIPSRVLTLSTNFGTFRISRSLADVSKNLSHLRLLLIFVCLGGIGIAALLGALVSKRAVAPLRRLTDTTDRIVETGDLSERIGHHGRDEISRLSARLDELLATLEMSVNAQRQFVADASHELRTPLATLRANFELLTSPGAIDEQERSEVLADVRDELESMTSLVAELVELTRGEEPDLSPVEFRLDEVVQAAVDRAARRWNDVSFRAKLEPSRVTGIPERIERAVANLLDNARKWGPAGSDVDVSVHDGLVEVRDHGPGIAEEDLPLVFNRFYRSKAARGMPGAGLGLAIVKQIAEAQGGSVSAASAPDGGAVLQLRLSPSS